MNLEFRPVKASDFERLSGFFCQRPNKTCDSVFLDSFIWRDYYQVQLAISDDKAIQWLMEENGVKHSAMPICREEDLEHYFYEMVEYFNKVLKLPFKIYLADEAAVEQLHLKESPDFEVVEQEDLKDYLYDGDALRKLSGKKLHKKKNHLNAFVKEFEGRYEYRRLSCGDRGEVWSFLDTWREEKGEVVESHLDYEVEGIHEILKNCFNLNVRMGGIYIDGGIGANNPSLIALVEGITRCGWSLDEIKVLNIGGVEDPRLKRGKEKLGIVNALMIQKCYMMAEGDYAENICRLLLPKEHFYRMKQTSERAGQVALDKADKKCLELLKAWGYDAAKENNEYLKLNFFDRKKEDCQFYNIGEN